MKNDPMTLFKDAERMAALIQNGGDEGASCGILLPVVAAKNIPGFKELFLTGWSTNKQR